MRYWVSLSGKPYEYGPILIMMTTRRIKVIERSAIRSPARPETDPGGRQKSVSDGTPRLHPINVSVLRGFLGYIPHPRNRTPSAIEELLETVINTNILGSRLYDKTGIDKQEFTE